MNGSLDARKKNAIVKAINHIPEYEEFTAVDIRSNVKELCGIDLHQSVIGGRLKYYSNSKRIIQLNKGSSNEIIRYKRLRTVH